MTKTRRRPVRLCPHCRLWHDMRVVTHCPDTRRWTQAERDAWRAQVGGTGVQFVLSNAGERR